ncbi:MAG: metallo-mystery pair system four-Cys motif protein [Polyangiaceae bacterium]|nr:metallo-mystery pair system four-Cys motif protein [Polyangiaceae bacterium]
MRTLTWCSGLALVAAIGCGDDSSTGASGGGGSGGDASGGAPSGGAPAGGGGSDDGGGGQVTGGGGGGGGAEPLDVEIPFEVRVGALPAECGQNYETLGAEPADVELSDLRFYIHDVRLVDAEGTEVPVVLAQDGTWQHENVALLDFEDAVGACEGGTAELNQRIRGTVPAGDYQGIAFRVGVPFELNHEDVATSPSPLNVTTLFWTWGFGHVFFSVITSATPIKGGDANQHFVHLGSTGCTGDPELGEVVSCTSPNRPAFSFDGFDPTTSSVVLNLEPLLVDSHLSTEVGCHSFPDTPACVTPFAAFGIDYATGELTPDQTIFSVE